MTKITRQTSKGVRWVEVNGGEADYAVHDGELVSINAEYIHVGEPRNPNGIRWTVRTGDFPTTDPREVDLLASDHMEWLRGKD